MNRLANKPIVDGKKDEIYENALVLDVSRTVCEQSAIPGDINAKAYVGYTYEYFCVYLEVYDKTYHDSDRAYILFDEKRFAETASELLNVEASREGSISITDGDGIEVNGVEKAIEISENGYTVEVAIPWRYKTTIEQYDSIGFDVFVFDNAASLEHKSVKAWNDFLIRYEKERAGEIFFR
jgi:hypothetical protein